MASLKTPKEALEEKRGSSRIDLAPHPAGKTGTAPSADANGSREKCQERVGKKTPYPTRDQEGGAYEDYEKEDKTTCREHWLRGGCMGADWENVNRKLYLHQKK